MRVSGEKHIDPPINSNLSYMSLEQLKSHLMVNLTYELPLNNWKYSNEQAIAIIDQLNIHENICHKCGLLHSFDTPVGGFPICIFCFIHDGSHEKIDIKFSHQEDCKISISWDNSSIHNHYIHNFDNILSTQDLDEIHFYSLGNKEIDEMMLQKLPKLIIEQKEFDRRVIFYPLNINYMVDNYFQNTIMNYILERNLNSEILNEIIERHKNDVIKGAAATKIYDIGFHRKLDGQIKRFVWINKLFGYFIDHKSVSESFEIYLCYKEIDFKEEWKSYQSENNLELDSLIELELYDYYEKFPRWSENVKDKEFLEKIAQSDHFMMFISAIFRHLKDFNVLKSLLPRIENDTEYNSYWREKIIMELLHNDILSEEEICELVRAEIISENEYAWTEEGYYMLLLQKVNQENLLIDLFSSTSILTFQYKILEKIKSNKNLLKDLLEMNINDRIKEEITYILSEQ
ncbi:MAG: hypothetical protein INQ03_22170 [Candidatus Heimdallarchaeota archaeon]|nr:hypothetical protein [Candidatus Heimdallarchaeota archaeon]